MDSFRARRYTLETKNIPLISKLRNLVSGGVSPVSHRGKACAENGIKNNGVEDGIKALIEFYEKQKDTTEK